MAISTVTPNLMPTPDEILEKIGRIQDLLLQGDDPSVQTDHVLHGGMYSRTVTLPAGAVLVGALIRKPTLVITTGTAKVLIGDEWADVRGYHVFPASAGRKQIFVALSPFIITMLFPTSAKTVEEAEDEFTSESKLLLSRRQDSNSVTITGE
jgi:hypothetical protein